MRDSIFLENIGALEYHSPLGDADGNLMDGRRCCGVSNIYRYHPLFGTSNSTSADTEKLCGLIGEQLGWSQMLWRPSICRILLLSDSATALELIPRSFESTDQQVHEQTKCGMDTSIRKV